MKVKSIESEVLKLPLKVRGRLAAALLSSLHEADPQEIERMWLDEADRRYRAFLQGKSKLIPADEAIAAARRALRK